MFEELIALLPSWPDVPQPQHLMPLAAESTQVWLLPAASRAPDTGPDGTVVEVVDVVEVDVVVVDADASRLRHFQICTSVSPRW